VNFHRWSEEGQQHFQVVLDFADSAKADDWQTFEEIGREWLSDHSEAKDMDFVNLELEFEDKAVIAQAKIAWLKVMKF
jgi:hypothetical protein